MDWLIVGLAKVGATVFSKHALHYSLLLTSISPSPGIPKHPIHPYVTIYPSWGISHTKAGLIKCRIGRASYVAKVPPGGHEDFATVCWL
jgi:hypothetical protein